MAGYAGAVLERGQWHTLIERIDDIESPVVAASRPSDLTSVERGF
jgi:hypothetical protein